MHFKITINGDEFKVIKTSKNNKRTFIKGHSYINTKLP